MSTYNVRFIDGGLQGWIDGAMAELDRLAGSIDRAAGHELVVRMLEHPAAGRMGSLKRQPGTEGPVDAAFAVYPSARQHAFLRALRAWDGRGTLLFQGAALKGKS